MNTLDLAMKLTDLFIAGTYAVEQWQAVQAKLREQQAEGRDPTPEEIGALLDQIEADVAAIREADSRLNG